MAWRVREEILKILLFLLHNKYTKGKENNWVMTSVFAFVFPLNVFWPEETNSAIRGWIREAYSPYGMSFVDWMHF